MSQALFINFDFDRSVLMSLDTSRAGPWIHTLMLRPSRYETQAFARFMFGHDFKVSALRHRIFTSLDQRIFRPTVTWNVIIFSESRSEDFIDWAPILDQVRLTHDEYASGILYLALGTRQEQKYALQLLNQIGR